MTVVSSFIFDAHVATAAIEARNDLSPPEFFQPKMQRVVVCFIPFGWAKENMCLLLSHDEGVCWRLQLCHGAFLPIIWPTRPHLASANKTTRFSITYFSTYCVWTSSPWVDVCSSPSSWSSTITTTPPWWLTVTDSLCWCLLPCRDCHLAYDGPVVVLHETCKSNKNPLFCLTTCCYNFYEQ